MWILSRWKIILAVALSATIVYIVFIRLPPRPQPTQRLEANWIASTLCSSPCWEMLEPGTTQYHDLQQRLAQNKRVALCGITELTCRHSSELPPNTTPLFARSSNVEQGHLLFDYDAQGAPLLLHEIALYPNPAITLDDVIGWFGYPSGYGFQQVNFETPQRYYLMLYYDRPGMEIMTSQIEVRTDHWVINWSQPIVVVSYLSPQAYTSRVRGCWWRSTTTLSKECSFW